MTISLLQVGFAQSHYNCSLFKKKERGDLVVILVYVDGLPVTGSSDNQILKTKKDLRIKFKMKYLGELKFFLGIEFARSKSCIAISQIKYALEVIYEIG